ncbi:monocarboxylate transporter 12-like [Mercenaria mercenaria]|uniref:monocarboxylate transporter 12-like n=1 Tax=Mercenaria mercenaria TaxID=6596 RepID=UPI00234E8FE8|nr:monocarboxylate transporter 12-like [Mercenaria mercenaria]
MKETTNKDRVQEETKVLKPEGKTEQPQDVSTDDFRDLDRGWAWVILFASFGTFCLLGGSVYSVGIIQSVLLQRYKESVSLTSWPGALNTALMSLGGPLSSAVVDRFSCRTAIISSGVFLTTAYLTTAFATNIYVTIFTYGFIGGIGGALGYTAALVVIGLNFRKRRHLAVGIAVSGVGAGLFVLAPVMQLSRDYYGPSGFFIIVAAMMANIIVFGVMCFPSGLEIATQKQRRHEVYKSNRENNLIQALKCYLRALTKVAVILLCLCMFLYCLGILLLYQHLPNFIVVKGFTAVQAAFLVSLSGLLTVFGRVLSGIITNLNRINCIVLYAGSMAVVSIASILYPFISNHFVAHVIYMVVLGLFFGCPYVTLMAVSLKFVGINYISAAIGLQYCAGGVGSFIGPVLAGFLIDSGGSYELSILIAACCIASASIISAATECFKPKDNEHTLDTEFEVCQKIQSPKETTVHCKMLNE